MGADLYIRKITDKAKEDFQALFNAACDKRNACQDPIQRDVLQQEVDRLYEAMYPDDGYFRDSYNATSVLRTLGLSWWNDVGPLLDQYSPEENSSLDGDGLRKFRQMIADAEQWLPDKEELIDSNALVNDDENTVESWHAYYREKRERLLKLIDHALEMGEPIYFSI